VGCTYSAHFLQAAALESSSAIYIDAERQKQEKEMKKVKGNKTKK
jgi:predicted N-acyltransferase